MPCSGLLSRRPVAVWPAGGGACARGRVAAVVLCQVECGEIQPTDVLLIELFDRDRPAPSPTVASEFNRESSYRTTQVCDIGRRPSRVPPRRATSCAC